MTRSKLLRLLRSTGLKGKELAVLGVVLKKGCRQEVS